MLINASLAASGRTALAEIESSGWCCICSEARPDPTNTRPEYEYDARHRETNNQCQNDFHQNGPPPKVSNKPR
jgi:hypothetical protein